MKTTTSLLKLAVLGTLLLGTAPFGQAQSPQFPPTLPANTAYGRLGIGAGPAQAIPFPVLSANLLAAIGGVNGQILVGVTGSPAVMATLSQDCTITNAGVITCTKTNNVAFAPSATTDTTNATNISSGTLAAGRLPNPSASTLGGVQSKTVVTHQFLTSISTSGVPASAQPAATDISGLATSATTDTTNATNITSGTLPNARIAASSITSSQLASPPVSYCSFAKGPSSTSPGSLGVCKTPNAVTVDNIELFTGGAASGFSSLAVVVSDCGTSVACGSPTNIGTGTFSTSTSTIVDGSVTTAAVAAGHYIKISLSGGSATVYDFAVSVAMHAQ